MSIIQGNFPSIGQSHDRFHYIGHAHFWERAMMSRRRFISTAAGATGLVLASDLWMPGLALADGAFPRHIPGGFSAFGKFFHAFIPAPTNENSTIFDFHGAIGATEIQGTGTGTNTDTGQQQSLLFDVDMRFMQGTYIGLDGEQHTGTFGFTWLDLYKGQIAPTNQIHDFNPGITHGVFWTIPIPDESVNVELSAAEASMKVNNQAVEDYLTLTNALMGGPSTPSTVSFNIHWSSVQQRIQVRDPKNRFVGQYIEDKATIAWSASRKDFTFVSDPANTSTSVFAAIGSERNGVFFS